MQIIKKKKIVIILGYKCNNNCLFCVNSDKRNLKNKEKKEIIKEIYLAKKQNADIIEFIGGETTIRNDFIEIISTARKLNIPDIVIATNGRMFSDINFAKKAINAGLSTVIFSVHGPNSTIHDKLTQVKGAFKQLIKGIENLKKIGFKNINGNTTIVKQNYRYLSEIAKLYIKYRIRNVEYIFVDPNYGGAYDNFYKLVPKISNAAPYMRKALDIGNNYGFDQWKVRYVPLCYFKTHLNQISELNEVRLFDTKHWAPDFINNDVLTSRKIVGRIKPEKCKKCKLYNICEGIWKEYLKKYGDGELKPVLK